MQIRGDLARQRHKKVLLKRCEVSTCIQDCAEGWGGRATTDECGICDVDSFNDCVVPVGMVPVPVANFMMGCNNEAVDTIGLLS